MIRRLRKRFIRIATLAVALVLVLLSLIVNTANFLSVDGGLKEMLQVICENQGKIPRAPHGGKPGAGPEGQFTQETPYSTRYFVLRYSDSGELVRADLEHIAAVTQEDAGEFLTIALEHGPGYGYASGYRYYVVDNGGGRWMAVFLDCYQQTRGLVQTAVFSLLAAAFCVALVYLIVVLCSRRAIDPVVRASEQQKQFITDASHELKTPITVIATSLKVLEMETGQQKWIDKAQAQTEKLKDLVNSLVTLCRLDEETSPLKAESFPVSDALRETAESFRDFARSQGHELTVDVTPELHYCGDEYAVRQLVSILLDNAVKYALPDSPIVFRLEKAKRGVTICVSNDCAPIGQAELDKLFDRFYRSDPARSAGGFGIGLSIARGIAQGHHGTIRAAMTGRQTVAFTVNLK